MAKKQDKGTVQSIQAEGVRGIWVPPPPPVVVAISGNELKLVYFKENVKVGQDGRTSMHVGYAGITRLEFASESYGGCVYWEAGDKKGHVPMGNIRQLEGL